MFEQELLEQEMFDESSVVQILVQEPNPMRSNPGWDLKLGIGF